MINSKLLKSLGDLTREKHVLGQKVERLAQVERRLIGDIGRALSTVGYRVVALDARRHAGALGAKKAPAAFKRLKCPRCDRRFAHPLPMARHLAATHHVRSGKKAPAKAKSA